MLDTQTTKAQIGWRACVGPEGGTGGPDPPPGKLQNIGFYLSSIQYWAIIGPPAKHH